MPPLMRAFSDRHPDVGLTLDVANQQTVLERMRTHRADVAILGKPPIDDRLAAEALVSNEIVCIAAPDDPAVRRPMSRRASSAVVPGCCAKRGPERGR